VPLAVDTDALSGQLANRFAGFAAFVAACGGQMSTSGERKAQWWA
jgi:hypothetical protein